MRSVEEPARSPEHLRPDLAWRTSSRCMEGNDCVELARAPQGIAFRDSTDTLGPVIAVLPRRWQALLTEIKQGAHDLH
ncbi:DUF397 domain-containing protein [Actinomadura rubrisoli]|uniref:DUF397 domain-containing protein n=1 Tax=Actinomadura rubrisoli TaxID=2530368 RepID=A0A4R5C5N0_9ACTN|nr:DUF397 domain-containing protein [Actinomadura rubrisoli]TDD93959.1 DUF397 domain-containing protein [Actinomadura rubrisoli]